MSALFTNAIQANPEMAQQILQRDKSKYAVFTFSNSPQVQQKAKQYERRLNQQFTCCDTIQDENMCYMCHTENICRECIAEMGEYGRDKEPVCDNCLPTCNECGEGLVERKDKCCGKGRSDDDSDDDSDY